MSGSSRLIDRLLALRGRLRAPVALSEEGVLTGRWRGGDSGSHNTSGQGGVRGLMSRRHRAGGLTLRTHSSRVKKRLFMSTSWLRKGFYDRSKGGGWLKKQFEGRNLFKSTGVSSKKAQVFFLFFFSNRNRYFSLSTSSTA